jgi:hypothetical protein
MLAEPVRMIMAVGIESAALDDVGNGDATLDWSSGAYALALNPAASALAFASRLGAYSGAGAPAVPGLAGETTSRSLALLSQPATVSIASAIDPIAVSLMTSPVRAWFGVVARRDPVRGCVIRRRAHAAFVLSSRRRRSKDRC